jgi:biopolymer transport protein ExbD
LSLPDPKRKASQRHRHSIDEPTLNLNPMMDMFAVLIPALLMLSAVLEISVLNVAAPKIAAPGELDQPPLPDEKPPLNLTLKITARGYDLVTGVGFVREEGTPGDVSVPLAQRGIACSRYRNYWPPPRVRNRGLGRCSEQALEKRTFWIYDNDTLVQRLKEIKTFFPEERRIIITAEPSVEYEVITDVMDATRSYRDTEGKTQPLFDEVVVSPGLVE